MVNGPLGWPRTQPDLGSGIRPSYPPYNVEIRDQVRADAWIEELRRFAADGNMPALEVLHLPSDHTAGGNPKYRSPRAYMADNDLALGRIAEALSHSRYWRDTVMFVLEDDSQAGPDHVDSHRGPLLVISVYNRPGAIHRFANTTDVLAAIEDILGLGQRLLQPLARRCFRRHARPHAVQRDRARGEHGGDEPAEDRRGADVRGARSQRTRSGRGRALQRDPLDDVEGRPADAGGAVEGVAAPAADQSMRKSRAGVRATE